MSACHAETTYKHTYNLKSSNIGKYSLTYLSITKFIAWIITWIVHQSRNFIMKSKGKEYNATKITTQNISDEL